MFTQQSFYNSLVEKRPAVTRLQVGSRQGLAITVAPWLPFLMMALTKDGHPQHHPRVQECWICSVKIKLSLMNLPKWQKQYL